MYDVILFPTDGSDGAEAALAHAIDLARRHDATLDVFHAGPDDDEEGRVAVEETAERARAEGVEANTCLLAGPPHEVIDEYVRDRGVDAVVMATHGRRGLDRYLLGSVTEKVLRTVDVPVLVVPFEQD